MHYDFSDGDPVREVLTALVVLVGLCIVMAPRPLANTFNWGTSLIAKALRRLGVFTETDLETELHRIDLLRVVLSLLVLSRFWPDFVVAMQTGNRNTLLWGGLGVFLSGALAAGVATPLTALLLSLLLNLIIDNFTANVSLGSMVVANCLIPLLFAPAGHTLSIDSALIRRRGILSELLRGLYGLWGLPTVDRIQVGRLLALVAYAAISLFSAIKHLESPTWISGAATGVLLLSPIASPAWSPSASWLYQHLTWAYVGFSVVSSYGMLL